MKSTNRECSAVACTGRGAAHCRAVRTTAVVDKRKGPIAKMMDGSSGMSSAHFAAYWANREPVRGRYTDERDDPLRVEDVLRQAHEEGRPLKPVRLVDQSASLLPLAEE